VSSGVGIIAATLIASAQLAAQVPADAARVQSEVARIVRAWDVPGVAVAIVKDGQVVMTAGYGVRRLGQSAPVT
jgi:CubicO group peptidase (beta-lactamase class C family)